MVEKRWRVTVEEWDAEAFAWRNKKRITFRKAVEDIIKETE